MTHFAALIAAGPLLIMVMAAAAMLVLHRALTRVEHALIWSASFAAFALQWVLLLLSGDWTGQTMLLGWPVRVAGFVGLALYVEGFRVRATGHRSRLPRLAIDAALLLFVALPAPAAWKAPHDIGVALIWAALFIHAMRLTPKAARRPTPTEWAMLGMLAAQAAIRLTQAALAVAALRGTNDATALAQAIGQATWLPGGAALGLFSMLLIASDLSAELSRVVGIDPLTGILNRAGFEAAARLVLGRARAPARPVSLAIADIDRFKSINDRHGHAVGDAALACVATQLARGLTEKDLIGRIGGEEFAMLLWDSGARAVERLEPARVEMPRVCLTAHPDIEVTVSVGIAEQAAGEGLHQVLERADMALYRSKNAGRDRTTLAETLTTVAHR